MHPKWMPFVTAVLNATPFLVSHDAPHMDAFSVKEIVNIESFCLTYCPWNRWWQMFSMSTLCFVRPSFGEDALKCLVRWKPFWQRHSASKTLACLVKQRPRVSSCLVFWDEEYPVRHIFKIIFRASAFFTWLWLYIPTLQNHSKMQPQPGDMELV